MKDLVFLKDKEPFTTSLVVAEGTGNEHRAVLQLIHKHQERFERWGKISFPHLKCGNKERDNRGRPTVFAELNEQQATFLITLLKNNDIVLDFKAELVDQFFKMREILRKQNTPNWGLVRQSSILSNRKLTDAIRDDLIPAARANGSTAPDEVFYINMERAVNKQIGIAARQRDKLDVSQLIAVDQSLNVAAASIHKSKIAGKDHKEIYSDAKAALKLYYEAAFLSERLPQELPPIIQLSLF